MVLFVPILSLEVESIVETLLIGSRDPESKEETFHFTIRDTRDFR